MLATGLTLLQFSTTSVLEIFRHEIGRVEPKLVSGTLQDTGRTAHCVDARKFAKVSALSSEPFRVPA